MKATKKTAITLLATTFLGAGVLPSLAMPGGSDADRHGGRGAGHAPIFSKYDADSDGVIRQEEIDTFVAQRFADLAGDGGSFTLEQFKASWYDESRPRMVKAFQRIDRDGDGEISREEFDTASEVMFLVLDRDGNGELTRPAPGEGRMERGLGRHGGPMSEGGPKGPKAHGGPDGRGGPRADGGPDGPKDPMMRGGHGGRDAHHGPARTRMGKHHGPRGRGGAIRGTEKFVAFMEKYDLDGDGKVTRVEFDEVRGTIFASGLAEGSDAITLDSFATLWRDKVDGMIVRAFQRYDTDGDLTVTFEEFNAPTKDFVKNHDANGDGVLTKADRGGRKHGGPGKHGRDKAGMPHGKPDGAPARKDG